MTTNFICAPFVFLFSSWAVIHNKNKEKKEDITRKRQYTRNRHIQRNRERERKRVKPSESGHHTIYTHNTHTNTLTQLYYIVHNYSTTLLEPQTRNRDVIYIYIERERERTQIE